MRDERRGVEDSLKLSEVAAKLRTLRSTSQNRRYRGAPPPLPSRDVVDRDRRADRRRALSAPFGPTDLAPRGCRRLRDQDARYRARGAQAPDRTRTHADQGVEGREPDRTRRSGPATSSRLSPPRCQRSAPCSTRTCAPPSRATRRPKASTKSSSAFRDSPRSRAIASRTNSTPSA